MVNINENYLKLKAGYLFPEIARRVKSYQEQHPQAQLIRLGIGDVVLPLVPSVVAAMKEAVDEMGQQESFHGYGPEQGYEFLSQAILEQDYASRGVSLKPSEIFISDGSKCDSANIQEIFSLSNQVAVVDPVYPVYVDTNVMAGRTGACQKNGNYEGILYLEANESNGFLPEPPQTKADLVYLCSPNNPTGATFNRAQLKKWVDYAHRHGSVLLFDAAYEAFITEPEIPHSIFEIDGAKEVAIELRSFSKTAGFTGNRCAFMVVPEALKGSTQDGERVSLNQLWRRRHTTKFNGVSYPVQKAALACYSEEGKKEIQANIDYYLQNAQLIREGLTQLGIKVFGGINAPYIWLKNPQGLDSWQLFDKLLEETQVVGTPGAGFGAAGEGYFRLSAFGFREKIQEAIERIGKSLEL